MADTFDAKKHGAVFAVPFGVLNAVTAQTNVDLTVCGVASTNTLVTMPTSGSVVGLSVKSTANLTAGTAAFAPHIASTEFAQSGFPNPTLNSTSGTSNASYAAVRPGVCTFTAGQTLGVSYTTSTDAAPTDTNDYTCVLFIQLDPN